MAKLIHNSAYVMDCQDLELLSEFSSSQNSQNIVDCNQY